MAGAPITYSGVTPAGELQIVPWSGWRGMGTVAFIGPFFKWAGLAEPGKVFLNGMDATISGRRLAAMGPNQ
jgi:hypothetical protein